MGHQQPAIVGAEIERRIKAILLDFRIAVPYGRARSFRCLCKLGLRCRLALLGLGLLLRRKRPSLQAAAIARVLLLGLRLLALTVGLGSGLRIAWGRANVRTRLLAATRSASPLFLAFGALRLCIC